VFNSAVPRPDTASIETMLAFQFDGTPLLLLSIQVNIEHVWAVAAIYTWTFTSPALIDYYLSVLLLHAVNKVIMLCTVQHCKRIHKL